MERRFWQIGRGALILIVLAIGIGVLFFFNPVGHGFYPRCPMYVLTGWACAGCGTLRAIHCLLHGEFVRALAFNPFLPVLALFFSLIWIPRVFRSPWYTSGFLLLSVIYTVLRNVYGF